MLIFAYFFAEFWEFEVCYGKNLAEFHNGCIVMVISWSAAARWVSDILQL